MPQTRYYVVSETRQVKVIANSSVDAILIANHAFRHGQNSDNGISVEGVPPSIWGNTTTKVQPISIQANEEL